ncbi:MAG: transcriptional regulator [Microbacterium sp.]|uniref:helix-turn-helix domain-containing protein n=1 Tax=Microbacterium aquimaris TaxID=459816 RepID=UPI000C9911B0|nr:helix-turn-helix domain-containing protein [Microbacterium aquimaris]MAP64240.1 transcriptional regulator [Microbacterium sp.]MDZ8275888.1 helix-turn-helix domain-containing protein [Microbacterium aquimaris]|tara:strand:- start:76 stop:702 length:627 start_codon:yes stop_codon:yes gene_type:complete
MDERQDDPTARAAARHAEDRVLDAGALRALAHPLRVRIYDILSQYGPQTASTLAQQLGESSGSTSYHLRALAKHQLIRECADRGTARERWWERPVGGVSFTNPAGAKTPSERSATQLVMSEFFRHRQDRLLEFVMHTNDGLEDAWSDGAMVSTAMARMTPEQLKELSLRIMALIDEAVDRYRDQDGDGVRPVSIRADLFPLTELKERS